MTNITDSDLVRFYSGISNWGHLDVVRALEVFKEAGLWPGDLVDEVNDFIDETGLPLKDIDICWVAYDGILQRARNKILEVLDFDFVNGDAEIYTYGNYVATLYDYTDKSMDKFKEILNKATNEQKKELREDNETYWFLKELEIQKIVEVKNE